MMPALSTTLIVLTLLTQANTRVVQPSPVGCVDEPLRVDLTAESEGGTWEVCVHPDVPVTWVFDPPLPPGSWVDLSSEDRFVTSQGPQLLSLLPRLDYARGERATLTVHFGDGLAPRSASFVLLGHPVRTVSQVRVTRHEHPEEVGGRRDNEPGPSERGRAEGLRGLLVSGVMDARGVRVRDITNRVSLGEGSALAYRTMTTYRAARRIAVEVQLRLLRGEPWTLEGASLVGAHGEELPSLPPWHTGQIKLMGRVMLEFEATAKQAQGSYTLNVWDSTGRVAAMGNITFPELQQAE